jgi:Fur family ferric uptake transcriptional regulator
MHGERLLRDRGLRVTRPRLAVLAVLTECRAHLDVEEITALARERLDSVSVQAVYDVLGALTAAGLARRIAPAGGAARYEARVGDNHHHLVCRRCGKITDVDCAGGAAPCLDPVETAGFVVDEAEVTYWGVCSTCRS